MNALKTVKALLASAILAALASAPGAHAAPFPAKTVTIVVPYAAGGSADALIRPVAERLSRLWGQPVIIENKSGANGIIATQAVMRAEPDGHTILLHLTGIIQNVSLYKKLPYDPFRDLAPVTQVGKQAMGIAVAASSEYTSIPAVIAAAKAKPADFAYGSFGIGSTAHIYGELFKSTQKLDMSHMAYRGEAPMLLDLMGGRIPLGFVSAATAVTRNKDKSLRILAVTGGERIRGLPDVPTLGELGYKGFDLVGWYGMFVPAATPKAVAEKISADVRAVIAQPEVASRMRDLAIEPTGTTPTEFAGLLKTEYGRWNSLIKQFNIELE